MLADRDAPASWLRRLPGLGLTKPSTRLVIGGGFVVLGVAILIVTLVNLAEIRGIELDMAQLRGAGAAEIAPLAGRLHDRVLPFLACGLVAALIAIAAAVLVLRRPARPLAALAAAIRGLASGARDAPIPGTELSGEVGDIARAIDSFRRALAEVDAARETAQRALAVQHEAEEGYRKIFEGSVEGIYLTTPEGQILNANPALAQIMGYDGPRALIDAVNDISHEIYVDPAARAEYALRMQRDGRVREFEYQARRRDGEILWLSDSATAVRDEAGRVVRYEGMVRDITDQKRAEAALAESRRRLQEVIDTVPAVVNVKDSERRYVLMNRYMAGIFGIEPEEAIGHTTADLMARYGASKSDSFDRRVLDTGEELGFYEDQYHDATGQLRHWMVNKLPLRAPDGKVTHIVSVALDIGDRKRAEQELRKAKEAAEAAFINLRETQNSLIEAEKLAALGGLVAGVAHEVNNPVGISLTIASSLQRRCEVFADEVTRGELRRSRLNEFLDGNRDASAQLVANLQRAGELINSFKQVAVDRSHADRRRFELKDATEQIVASLRPGLSTRRLTLSADCPADLVMDSYPGPYGQILTNLFLNAVAHAFPQGGPGHIGIAIRAAGDDLIEILFTDDGCGMTQEVRRRAFDPFFTTLRGRGGTGLGLHIVHNIVTSRLGGRISIASEPGKGTLFRILLPKVAPDEVAESEVASASAEAG